jgi:hypothetical protein
VLCRDDNDEFFELRPAMALLLEGYCSTGPSSSSATGSRTPTCAVFKAGSGGGSMMPSGSGKEK